MVFSNRAGFQIELGASRFTYLFCFRFKKKLASPSNQVLPKKTVAAGRVAPDLVVLVHGRHCRWMAQVLLEVQ